ncbi:MAG TPA: hypothetical protein PL128_10450 [Ginsengibacter sp.]|nr:hypothetical protein [Ginsengibacter sp.]
MGYLLFFIYLTAFCILLLRVPFFRNSGILAKWLVGLFLCRVIVGAVHAYIDLNVFEVSDTVEVYQRALRHFNMLKADPIGFIIDLFRTPYDGKYGDLFGVHHSFWNNLKLNFLIKIVAVFDLLSLKNFYINVLLYNMLVFFGAVGLYRALDGLVPGKKWLLIVGVFLFPSGLYFTSAIHKDGFVWLAIGLIALALRKIDEEGFTIRRGVAILASLLLVFVVRNYVALVIVPALLAYGIGRRWKRVAGIIYPVVFLFCVVLFFGLRYLIPSADFPAILIDRQHAFMEIPTEGTTKLPMPDLRPDAISFGRALIPAINHSFFQPFIFTNRQLTMTGFAMELLLVQLLFLLFLVRRVKCSHLLPGFLIFVSLVDLLLIGYIVPFPGAIIRYRSVFLNLIFIVLLMRVDFRYFLIKSNIIKNNM